MAPRRDSPGTEQALRPSVWCLDLSTLEPGGAARTLDRLERPRSAAAWMAVGGSAAALLALELAEALPGGAREALALAVGPAVRAGVPTAARATVAGVGPLTGRYVEGQVGGELGPLLAQLGGALLLHGRAQGSGLVLVIEPGPRARLERWPELVGATPADTESRLGTRLALGASLRVGPAGERGALAAGLVSGQSFVGRGGLGARFGAGLSLKALVFEGFSAGPAVDQRAWTRLLQSSPRLEQRSELGTLELLHGSAARGEAGLSSAQGASLAQDAQAARASRHGCRGCPTPCGWSFARSQGPAVRAHFGATLALLPERGPERFDAALGLLAMCDRLGVDAKEVGAALELWCRAEGDRFDGERAARLLARALEPQAPERILLDGAVATARQLGLPAPLNLHGQVAPRGLSGAMALAQWSSSGGSDPMRAFPFLEQQDAPRDERGWPRFEDLPTRLWWHQNLVAALDVSGFCAFAAAGLLADRVLALEEFAARLWPAQLPQTQGSAADRFIGLGAALIERRRALDARLGAAQAEPPAGLFAAEDLAALELLRGRGLPALDSDAPEFGLWSVPRALPLAGPGGPRRPLGTPRSGPALASAAAPGEAARPGRVELFALGPLGRALGRALPGGQLGRPLPASLAEVLASAAALDEELAARLLREGRILPEVLRRGQRLAPGDRVEDGDRLDLVLAIAGG
jgi:aldehyde:ferredoxin oxidoreductase